MKSPWCSLVCGGISNTFKFLSSLAEFTANGVALALLIAAFVGADASTGGLTALLSNFVVGSGLQDVRNVIDGVEGMIDSTEDHNPVLDIIADGLKVLLDLGTLISTFVGLKAVQISSEIKSATQIARFFGAIGQFLQGKQVNWVKYVGPAASAISGIASGVSAAGQLVSDAMGLWGDVGSYQQYAQAHY